MRASTLAADADASAFLFDFDIGQSGLIKQMREIADQLLIDDEFAFGRVVFFLRAACHVVNPTFLVLVLFCLFDHCRKPGNGQRIAADAKARQDSPCRF